MTEEMPSANELYRVLLDRARQIGASDLADQINRMVGRGVVELSPRKEGAKSKEERTFRPATEEESLALAVELLLAAAEVPLMLARVREICAATELEWLPDDSVAETSHVSTDPLRGLDSSTLRELQARLLKLSEILAELNLKVPEVA